jgi:hypothetical protein
MVLSLNCASAGLGALDGVAVQSFAQLRPICVRKTPAHGMRRAGEPRMVGPILTMCSGGNGRPAIASITYVAST